MSNSLKKQKKIKKATIKLVRMNFWVVLMAVFVFFPVSSSAVESSVEQSTSPNTPKKLSFNIFDIEKGLSDNNVNDIIQDDLGFVWLATRHGLSRYDGLNINSFYHDLNEPESISNNIVKTIFQDQLGKIWVGTVNGLNHLNNQQSGFIKYFHNANEANSLTSSYITAISQDKGGRIWFGTENGVNLLQTGQQGKFKRYLFQADMAASNMAASNIAINFLQLIDSTILAGTNKGLFLYDIESDQFVAFENNISMENAGLNAITSFIDSNNTLWISVEKEGVFYNKSGTNQFRKLTQLDDKFIDFKTDNITSINEDVNGNIWLGSIKSGLMIYSTERKMVTPIKLQTSSKASSYRSAGVKNFMRDESGLMWMGTELLGVFQWSPNTGYINHFDEIDSAKDESILGSFIWSFKEDNEGNIWLATFEGAKVFNPKTGNIDSISIKLAEEEKEPEVFQITMEKNHIWFATYTSLIRYTPDIGVTRRIGINSSSDFSLPKDANVFGVEYIKGVLYAAVVKHGILAFDLVNEVVKTIALKGKDENAPSSVEPLFLKAGSDGSLWILSPQGLFNYSPEQDRIRIAIGEGIEQLSNGYISAFFEESPQSIWLGTSGNGINHLIVDDYDKGIYRVEQYNHISELKNQVINGLVLDNSKPANIWLSTHNGLYYFNRTTEKVRHLTSRDGIQAKEYNEGAYFRDRNGYIYFGGINGFNRINSLEFSTSTYQPPLRVTDFSVQCASDNYPCNKAINIKELKSICEDEVCGRNGLKRLSLPRDLEKLEISFVALDFTDPEKNNYRYRFYGNEKTPWINLNHENHLLFTNLESDDYILEIQGSNHAGIWSPRIVSFSFSVEAPWYMQIYSFLILVIIILFVLDLYMNYQKINVRAKRKVQLAIKKSEENFKFALWGSGDELWEWNTSNDDLIRTNPIKNVDNTSDPSSTKMAEVFDLIHPDDREQTGEAFYAHIKGESSYFESFYRIKKVGGGYLWILGRGRVVERDASNKAIRVLGSNKDVSLLKATEDKLKLIAKAFENTMDGISILNPDFKSVLNNQAFYKITGLSATKSINKQYFFSEESENHDKYQQIKIALRNFGEWNGEIWETRSNGDQFAIELKIDTVLDTNRHVSNYICIFSEITYRKKSENELRKLANFDSLTELPNRSLFMDRLNHAYAFAKRNNTKFALLFIDLDHFKKVNDSLGHSTGDDLLRKVAKRLSRCVRDVDTVARLGGDEFVIILENIHNADEVGSCASKIIQRMKKSFDISGTVLNTSPSIGIGIFPSDGDDIETLLKNADLAMYSAKEKGRNNYQFFTADMTSSAVERITIENKLREAIDKQQLELFYQPKVDSETGKLAGFEALVRWLHPEDGMISPADFIPVAEETGLIIPMGDWILEEAVQQAKIWSEINPECCSIAINISARQFQQGKLSNAIAKLLNKYQLSPRFIELEITEGTLMSNMEHAIKTLDTLRSMGISLSLDDFGTGYSSLSYLKRFPVNKLKIDQSFVRDITTDPCDASIVASIINLAHNLGLNVIAEGCETLEQLSFICSYNCEEVQGYLFSRPLPKKQAEQILKAGQILIDK